MKLFGNITIQPWSADQWQAHAPLLETEWASLPGVCGSQHKEGPWVGGTGKTPEDALTALRLAIGGVVLAACAALPTGSATRE